MRRGGPWGRSSPGTRRLEYPGCGHTCIIKGLSFRPDVVLSVLEPSGAHSSAWKIDAVIKPELYFGWHSFRRVLSRV